MIKRLGLRHLTTRLNDCFEERIAERRRIAQELHDTLLQGFLSASMQLHVAVADLPANLPAKQQFSRIAQLLEHVIDEGRSAIQGLRSSRVELADLEQAFVRVQHELALQSTTGFRVIIEGRPRLLNPGLRDEVYWIGREAILNAYRHSRAASIETEIDYAPDRLCIAVRDDGCGIDPDVLQSGREGHCGLQGMRERAKRINARIRVFSRATAGTEVVLC